jgi:hypothetical protein
MASRYRRWQHVVHVLVILSLLLSLGGASTQAPRSLAVGSEETHAEPSPTVEATQLSEEPGPTQTATVEARPSPTATPAATATLEPTATPSPDSDEVRVTPEEGGELRSADGRVRLIIPEGAVTQAVRITHRPRRAEPLPPRQAGMALEFELHAVTDDALAVAVHEFEKELELRVDLSGLIDLEAMPYYQYAFLAYQDARGQWQELPTYRAGSQLLASLDHFSLIGGGAGNVVSSGWLLAYNDAHVSTFSGALTYDYPIEVPEGRGGLTPDLRLSYNSRRIDGILTWMQSDWVGSGWTVDTMEIVRKVTPDWGTGSGSPAWCWEWFHYENSFTLLYNGTGYRLKPASGNPYGRYHTEDEQFLYVERRNTLAGNGSPANTTGEYWIVRLRDGTEFRLGYNGNAEQTVTTNYYGSNPNHACRWSGGQPPTSAACYAGHAERKVAFRWRADLVTDRQGNQIELSYHETPEHTNPCGGYRERSSYSRRCATTG